MNALPPRYPGLGAFPGHLLQILSPSAKAVGPVLKNARLRLAAATSVTLGGLCQRPAFSPLPGNTVHHAGCWDRVIGAAERSPGLEDHVVYLNLVKARMAFQTY